VNTRKKGIIFFALVAGIMLSSGVTIAINPASWFDDSSDPDVTITETGSPLDSYSLEEQPQFCSTSEKAKKNTYVQEFKIPTPCTQPLAITVDPQGLVWFAQTNTGGVAKFNPITQSFTEYENTIWPEKGRSMMWGIDYSPDGSIWYTDEASDSIWKFSTLDESYNRIAYPVSEDETALPQKLTVKGSQIIVNDFTGSKLTFFTFNQQGEDQYYTTIPSLIDGSVTSDFTIDSEENIWYTTWIPQKTGILIKFDYQSYELSQATSLETQTLFLQDFTNFFQFPDGLSTPNGITVGPNQKIWIADTSSSFFFSFDPENEEFTKYITSPPDIQAYGNSTGLIKTPITRPYWIEHSDGNLVMNEQTGNRIAVFNPSSETLVEYNIPSRNPNWADCEGIDNCGVSQVFDFAIDGKKIWFTEWVENNIGVVDTSIPLDFSISIDKSNITLEKGQTTEVILTANPEVNNPVSDKLISVNLSSASASLFSDIVINAESNQFILNGGEKMIPIQITAGEHALSDTHKVLLGLNDGEVTISQFINVKIIDPRD
jgi:virginiamycin B lyase